MPYESGTDPSFCANCPAADCGAVLAESRKKHRFGPVREGAVIYRSDSAARDLFMVRGGLVKLLHYSRGGEERIVRLLRPGSLFGFEALLGRCYRRQAAAATVSEICRLPSRAVLDENRTRPAALQVIFAQYQKTIDMADTLLSELNSGSAQRRVAQLFHFLADGKDGREIPLLSREEMAALLGITVHTASRVVADFRRKGLLQTVGRRTCCYRLAGLAL